MKKSDFKLMIRKMVREEVAMAIQEVITELKQSTQQVSQPKPKKKMVEKRIYSTNPVLNDVLNETAQAAVLTENNNTITEMDNMMQASYGDMMDSKPSVATEDTSGIGQFLNKDYSAVLNKSYEKDGNR